MAKVKLIIENVKKLYGQSSDLQTRIIEVHGKNVGVLFMESSSSSDNVSDFVVKSIDYVAKNTNKLSDVYQHLKNNIFNSQLTTITDFKDFPYYLSSGFTIVIVDGSSEAIALETRATLDRGVTESTSEPILRGPKDSFTESNAKNLGLIRKRIKDHNLWFDEVKVGARTQSKVNIAYIKDIADQNCVTAIKEVLKKIDIDGILDGGNLREYLLKKKSVFPQILSTERPDLACQSLLNGKIVILVENSPFVLILPNVFIDFIIRQVLLVFLYS